MKKIITTLFGRGRTKVRLLEYLKLIMLEQPQGLPNVFKRAFDSGGKKEALAALHNHCFVKLGSCAFTLAFTEVCKLEKQMVSEMTLSRNTEGKVIKPTVLYLEEVA